MCVCFKDQVDLAECLTLLCGEVCDTSEAFTQRCVQKASGSHINNLLKINGKCCLTQVGSNDDLLGSVNKFVIMPVLNDRNQQWLWISSQIRICYLRENMFVMMRVNSIFWRLYEPSRLWIPSTFTITKQCWSINKQPSFLQLHNKICCYCCKILGSE